MQDRISRAHVSIPAHLFGLKTQRCVLETESEFQENFEHLLTCLSKQSIEAFLPILCEYASRFIQLLDEKQGHSADYIDAYNSIVLNFLKFYQKKHSIDPKWVEKNLNQTGLIEYLKLSAYCIQIFTDYQNQRDWTSEQLSLFARFYVIKPFIMNLLPLDENQIESIKKQGISLALTQDEINYFNTIIKTRVLGEEGRGSLIRQQLENFLQRELTRLSASDEYASQWYCFWLDSPKKKIESINSLLSACNQGVPLTELSERIKNKLSDPSFTLHRNLLFRFSSKLLWKTPCDIEKNLDKFFRKNFSNYLLTDKIAQRLLL